MYIATPPEEHRNVTAVRNIGEGCTCISGDMLADRQTLLSHHDTPFLYHGGVVNLSHLNAYLHTRKSDKCTPVVR